MTQVTDDLAGRLVEFVEALRSKGIPTGPSESVDAAEVIRVLGMENRDLFREGLAAALIRRGGQRDVFDKTFDLYFPLATGATQVVRDHEDVTIEDLRDLLTMALAENDLRTLEQVAELAVDALGRVGNGVEGSAGQSGFSAYQTLDRMQPQTTLVAALAARGSGGSGAQGTSSGGQGGGSDDLDDRLAPGEIRRNIQIFRELVASEARRRTAEERGREVVTRHAVQPGGDRIEFLTANRQQLEELRSAVRPLSRKLATRLAARRHRARRGRIDIRRTLRRSMGTGGVPIKPAYAKPHPARPELVLLCDVSGSVAGFSNFTMLLVQALSDQFSKIRVFAFVNAMAEVTDLVKADPADLGARISSEARITKWHTSSDYGEAFADFVADHLNAIGPRTSVLILGDARNNNQDPNLAALHQIAAKAKRVFWLNPEYHLRWGLGDSVAPRYAEVVDMFECRNIDQLSRFIGRLLPV
ncbi:MAG TPA: VWA domain-containing protein [Aeromicrobium sp.]|nr:VWA domain-containing protein [Aeromicrobium sp.]